MTVRSHAEATANAILGAILAQCTLWLYGIPIEEALSLNLTLIGVSYARAFVIRRAFARIE